MLQVEVVLGDGVTVGNQLAVIVVRVLVGPGAALVRFVLFLKLGRVLLHVLL